MSSYDQQDIKAILNRAVELQQRSSGSEPIPDNNESLSLKEIEEIAKDAGVSPDYVREAALEYEGIPVEKPLFIDTGDYNQIELIGFAKGKLDKRTWAELRSIIEYHFDSPGKVTRRPDGIQWKAMPKGILKFLESRKSPAVEIESENHRTSIRITKSLKTVNKYYIPSIAALLASALFFAFTVTGEMGSDGEGLIPTFIALAFFEISRRWVQRKKKKRRENLKELMQQLQTIVTRRFKASITERDKAPGTTPEILDIEEEANRQSEPGNTPKRARS